eukprot:1782-Heterococcus_DN1.PRE.1
MTLADAVITAYDERAMLRKVGLSSAVVDAYWGTEAAPSPENRVIIKARASKSLKSPQRRRRPASRSGIAQTSVVAPPDADTTALRLGRMLLSSIQGSAVSSSAELGDEERRASRFFLDMFLRDFGSSADAADAQNLRGMFALEDVKSRAAVKGTPNDKAVAVAACEALDQICAGLGGAYPALRQVRDCLQPFLFADSGSAALCTEPATNDSSHISSVLPDYAAAELWCERAATIKATLPNTLLSHEIAALRKELAASALALQQERQAHADLRDSSWERVCEVLKAKLDAEQLKSAALAEQLQDAQSAAEGLREAYSAELNSSAEARDKQLEVEREDGAAKRLRIMKQLKEVE